VGLVMVDLQAILQQLHPRGSLRSRHAHVPANGAAGMRLRHPNHQHVHMAIGIRRLCVAGGWICASSVDSLALVACETSTGASRDPIRSPNQ